MSVSHQMLSKKLFVPDKQIHFQSCYKKKKVKLPECTSAHGISNPEPHLGHKAEMVVWAEMKRQ